MAKKKKAPIKDKQAKNKPKKKKVQKSSANFDTVPDGLRMVVYEPPPVKKEKIYQYAGRRGRPRTHYTDDWCDMLIEHMSKGLSFESFAAVVSISRSKLYELLDEYPEFLDAKKEAEPKCELFWEKMGIMIASGKLGKSANGVVWMMNMNNRFPHNWKLKRDEQIQDKQKEDEDLTSAPDETLDAELDKLKNIGNVKP